MTVTFLKTYTRDYHLLIYTANRLLRCTRKHPSKANFQGRSQKENNNF